MCEPAAFKYLSGKLIRSQRSTLAMRTHRQVLLKFKNYYPMIITFDNNFTVFVGETRFQPAIRVPVHEQV